MISVILPSYNRAEKLKRSALSVLNQSYRDIELIIVDDGSTDNTREAARSLDDKRVKYIYQQNSGACAARNAGIACSSGEYVAFQDSDDYWIADKLEKQLDCLLANNADLVFCKYFVSNGFEKKAKPDRYSEGFLSSPYNVYGIGTQTILAKKEVLQDMNFDIDMPRFQDLELLLRVCRKYRVYCLDIPLVEYNVGSDSLSRSSSKLYSACELLLKKHPEINSQYPQTAKSLARLLMLESKKSDNSRSFRQKLRRLSLMYDGGIKNRVKFIINKIMYN